VSWSEVALVATLVVVLLLWWVWVMASRLDRLHRKVGSSRAVVDGQLVRRATVAAELATSGLLDPVSSLIVAEAAWSALAAGGAESEVTTVLPPELRRLISDPEAPDALPVDGPDRGRIESELSATLREVLADPDELATLRADPAGDDLVGSLGQAWYRVQLSRRFLNEAVAQTQRVRRKPVVRLLRLAGHAPWPRTLELDDEWPAALGRPGARTQPDGAGRPDA